MKKDSKKEELFQELYNLYYANIYRYIYSSIKRKRDAEDVVSTVFFNIYKHRDEIVNVNNSKIWIFKIANDAIIGFHKKNMSLAVGEETIDQIETEKAYKELLIKDEANEVNKIIDELPLEVKNMIYMKYYGELKYKEIAEILSVSENLVKFKIVKHIKNVKKIYEELMSDGKRIL